MSQQPLVEIGVSDVRAVPLEPNQANVTLQQHFKGWGRTSRGNWESWGAKQFTVWRSADGWKITKDTFKREVGHSF